MPDLDRGEPDLGRDGRQLSPLCELLGGGWRRFSKLPDDVWMNIMRYLKPLDIAALRQVRDFASRAFTDEQYLYL